MVVKRQRTFDWVVCVGLVAAGVLLRLTCQGLPNFAPIAALAMFAGFLFRSWTWAVAVPLGALAASDLFLGGYDWHVMTTVYLAMIWPVALRGWLRRGIQVENRGWASAVKSSLTLLSCSLSSSIVFFVLTNLSSWYWFEMYEHTPAGLLHCYVRALPFFRNTLLGDACFASLFFGGYAVAVRAWGTASRIAQHRGGVAAVAEL